LIFREVNLAFAVGFKECFGVQLTLQMTGLDIQQLERSSFRQLINVGFLLDLSKPSHSGERQALIWQLLRSSVLNFQRTTRSDFRQAIAIFCYFWSFYLLLVDPLIELNIQ
jgi:hypothetical protein